MNFILPAKLYDVVKYLVMIVIPAASTFYATLGTINNWDNVTNVTVTLAALATLLGALIGISTKNYNNTDRFVGETWLKPTDEGWKRVFNVTSEEIDPGRKEITFKVVDNQAA
jgi:hypothetical protein